MKPWIVLTVDAQDDDTSLLTREDFDTQPEAEAKYEELKEWVSNVYLVQLVKQSENI